MAYDKWDLRYYKDTLEKASWSKDPSTKVGAIIVKPNNTILSNGYNGFPRGTDDSDVKLNNREVKYLRTVHAELNAILNCETRPVGCTIYVRPLPPCAQCSAAIIQSGITRVVCPPLPNPDTRWYASCKEGYDMFMEAGLIVDFIEDGVC